MFRCSDPNALKEAAELRFSKRDFDLSKFIQFYENYSVRSGQMSFVSDLKRFLPNALVTCDRPYRNLRASYFKENLDLAKSFKAS